MTIANAISSGVADDKLVYTYMPELTRYYLGEDPIIPNVQTWRLEDPGSLEEVLDRLDELVIKPVDGSGGKGLVIGPAASKEELAELKERLLLDPRGWIAQPVVQLSTIPPLVDEGMRPRHADLRPFAVNDGRDVWVLPGGLTRVALPEGQLVVNSSQGGGSKDTWVVGQDPLSVSRHSIQGLVAGQATVTEAITILSPELVQHTLGDRPIETSQQEQQQQQAADFSASAHSVPALGRRIEVGMLSRIAESLFWIGRYIERSDGTARILDVHLQLLLEDPWIEEDLACRALLSVMGTEVPEDQTLDARGGARHPGGRPQRARHPSRSRSTRPGRTRAVPARS